MNHTTTKNLAIRVVILAAITTALLIGAITINIQTAAAAKYLGKGTTDGINKAREKTATVFGFHKKLSNNCSGFEFCINIGHEETIVGSPVTDSLATKSASLITLPH
jgi:hypothetical protein